MTAPYPPQNVPYMQGNTQPAYPPHGYQQQSVAPNNIEVNLASQVEIHISCRNLLDMDTFSKSDPLAVMLVFDKSQKKWREYGRTELIMNNLNPDFAKSFVIDYFFEEIQKLRFEVYDIDSASSDLSQHDFIGCMESNLGSILGERGGRYESKLSNPKFANCGSIIVTAEEVQSCKDFVTLQFNGRKLDKKDFFGKSDPFLAISRCNEDNSFTVVHRTEVKKSTLKPRWLPFKVPARVLCNGDYERTLRIECYDWNRNGSHALIGLFETSLGELESFNSRKSSYPLINPRKKEKKKSYDNSGIIDVIDCKIEKRHSFLDYIRGGTELCFVVAIDFTASNGNPNDPSSLHYKNPYSPNQYMQALSSVGAIIQDYATHKLFPAFGFGARLLPSNQVSHKFSLNGNPNDPLCHGIDGITAAYMQSISSCQLYGPTNFSPVINSTANIAQQSIRNPGAQYYVLLIITDGIITDMERTKEAIVSAANLPMSLIIVGVGGAEFDAMEELDGDDIRVSYGGREAARDIVQFVPFRDFQGSLNQYDTSTGERLAKEVLAELPGQIEEFMTMQGIKPKAST